MIRKLNLALSALPDAPVALMLRVFPALVFWQSGQTKVEGWSP
jgi:putative oxidoreductase